MLVALVVGFTAILVRLALLQVKDAGALQALARDQRVRDIPLAAPRGTIFDRNGQELAMSLPAKAVFADPYLVRDARAEARAIADTLHLSFPNLLARLTSGGRFVYLARGVDLAVAKALQERNLPGFGLQDEGRRYYPAGALAPQVLGVVGVDGTGLAGIELEYQKLLSGRPGREIIEEDPSGTVIPQGESVDHPPVAGDDLLLTIDREVQYRAQVALAQAVKANHAKGGTVIVMDPHTGDVLAMATSPWFDPNRLAQANPDNVTNRAVTDVYEPGSVNKVITAAAAVEEGALSLNQRLSVADTYTVYGRPFHDAHPHPVEQMTLADIIAY